MFQAPFAYAVFAPEFIAVTHVADPSIQPAYPRSLVSTTITVLDVPSDKLPIVPPFGFDVLPELILLGALNAPLLINEDTPVVCVPAFAL